MTSTSENLTNSRKYYTKRDTNNKNKENLLHKIFPHRELTLRVAGIVVSF